MTARGDGRRVPAGWRVLVAWLAAVGAVLGLSRAVVALPERCGALDDAAARTVAERAVAWFAANERPDGRWRYRWDADEARDLGGYNWVRHSGVLLSLEQAAAAGIPGAAEAADAGWPAALDRLLRRDGFAAIPEDDGTVYMGGTALLAVALGERLGRGGDADAGLLRDLGRALLGQVDDDGEVADRWDPATGAPVEGSRSPFTPGEVAFALARIDRLLPGEGFAAPVGAIIRNLRTTRAEVDGYVPDASDHWSAYATAELVASGAALPEWHVAWARRQMGIMAIQVRYESQRTNGGIDRWLRGRQTIPAGLGTIGEASAAWWRAASGDPALGRWASGMGSAARCVAGVLADRQVGPDARPEEAGAWFQFGVTQMDDQQHALSAVLGALGPIAEDGPLPTGEGRRPGVPVPEEWPLALLAMVAAVNPFRAARRARADGASLRSPASFATAAVLVVLALAGGVVTRSLGISGPVAVVAAGVVLAAAGLVAVLRPDARRGPASSGFGTELAPPAAVVVAMALGAGGRVGLAVAGVAVAVGLAVALRRADDGPGLRWAERLLDAVAVLAGAGLLVAGIFAV